MELQQNDSSNSVLKEEQEWIVDSESPIGEYLAGE
jgi:hypothetical protein